MNARKTLLFLAILATGGSSEVLWRLRGLGASLEGCWLLPSTFRGPAVSVPSEKTVAVAQGVKVSVENAFGRVTVRVGDPRKVRVGLDSVVYLANQTRAHSIAEKVAVEAHLEGEVLKIGTNRDALEADGRLGGTGLETHLEVRVPPGTVVEVKGEHGAVSVSQVASASVESSFADLMVSEVAGPAHLVSRHGDVTVSDIQGPLDLESHYGDVSVGRSPGETALRVEHGDLTLDHSGAAKVDLRNGDLKGSDIHGSLDFVGEHAGVDVSHVETHCSIATNSRNVEVHDVKGDLKVKTEHGGLEATGIGGDVEADVSFDDVHLSGVKGTVQASVTHGGFKAEDLRKGARLNVSGDDVTLASFHGPLSVEATRGSVELKPSSPIMDPVNVTTTNGGIRLEVPQGSRFDLDAMVASGDLSVGPMPQFVHTLESPARITGKLAGGGSTVHLSASQGDVNVAAEEKP